FDDFKMQNNFSTFYLNVKDRIELVRLDAVSANFRFMNIDKFQSWGITTEHQYWWRILHVSVGAAYLGVLTSLLGDEFNLNTGVSDEYRYTFQGNFSANYKLEKIGTTVSAYYKYTGKSSEFVTDANNITTTEQVYRLVER